MKNSALFPAIAPALIQLTISLIAANFALQAILEFIFAIYFVQSRDLLKYSLLHLC